MDLTEVAEMLAQAGETLLAALAAEYTLSKNPNSLAAVALAFAWAGEADQARQAAEQALQQRQSSSDPSSEPGLADLAQAFALIGDVDQAWALAKDGWYERRQVTQALLRSGQLELLFSLADRAADPKSRDVTLGDIADALVEAGELDEALKAARMINHEWQRARAITSVLHALGKANQPSQAIPLFRQELAVNRKSSRLDVLELLQTACLVIAKIDERITLWRMHEAWTKIDAELASSES
jgi:tetratricopeptide (TPR) repeat protein